MSAAEAKGQTNFVLDEIAEVVNQLAKVDTQINEIQGSILLLGLSESNNQTVTGSVTLAEMAKQANDNLLNFLFDLRQRLTVYRDALG